MVVRRCLAIAAACLPSLCLPFVPLHAKAEHGLLHAPSEGSQELKVRSTRSRAKLLPFAASLCYSSVLCIFPFPWSVLLWAASEDASFWRPPWGAWELSEAGQNLTLTPSVQWATVAILWPRPQPWKAGEKLSLTLRDVSSYSLWRVNLAVPC